MIQRIQTVFLFLVVVAMVLVVVFPIWHQVNPDQTQIMTLDAWSLITKDVASDEVIAKENKMIIGILAVLAASLATYSMLQYKNRTRQMFINMMNSLVMLVCVGLIVWITHSANEVFNPNVNGAFVLGFWAFFGGLVMNLLANRFIRKDEMLVRSVDRIR
jgi:drug/metabolite transporter (DMT)-like permease